MYNKLPDEILNKIKKLGYDIEFAQVFDGLQYIFTLPNCEYSFDCIKHSGSYGAEQDLWEAAILKDKEICYTTNITEDVLGYQTPKDILDIAVQLLKEIERYKPSLDDIINSGKTFKEANDYFLDSNR